MKLLRLVSLVFFAACCALRAQEEQQRPPEEITIDFGTDEYIYTPLFKLNYGFRGLTGAKLSFSGQGRIASNQGFGAATGALTTGRSYHDGFVQVDGRVASFLNDDGSTGTTPITPDGKTNTWRALGDSQFNAAGDVEFHAYAANVTDTASRSKDNGLSFGTELVASRDLGKLGGRIPWSFFAGFSLNDLHAKMTAPVQARITTVTDTYSLFGAPNPATAGTGYSAPSSTSVIVSHDDGSTGSVSFDNTTLLANQPSSRVTSTATSTTAVVNKWKLKGAYFTFRAGPTFDFPITAKLHASFSIGPAFALAGSTYTVTETFTPTTADALTSSLEGTKSRLLPGFYVDATLNYDLTDRTGFYAGASYQSTGKYTQDISKTNDDGTISSYQTKVDLASQEGLRAGVNFKF